MDKSLLGGEGMTENTDRLPEALKTFRYDFDIRVFVDRNKGEWHMPMEWHTSLEIFICLKGKGRYYIGSKLYEFEEGDIFVISNAELHKSEIYENGSFDALLIMFSPEQMLPERVVQGEELMDLFYGRIGNFSHQHRPESKKRALYETVAGQMLKEYEEKQMGYKESLRALLMWMLIELNRAYRDSGSQDFSYVIEEKIKHKKVISQVLLYIEEHYDEDINLGELADRLYVNQSYLSREFKKSTGYSMVKFITNKRIREARELLRSTSLSVTEIATRVGYNNITHFHTMFKKEIGISPKEFRKQLSTMQKVE